MNCFFMDFVENFGSDLLILLIILIFFVEIFGLLLLFLGIF